MYGMSMELGRRRVQVHAAILVIGWYVSLGQGAAEDKLHWANVTNRAALCNDFTQAGFFHRRPTENGAGKWIIYLESGAVCYSNETCNRRYFNSTIQDRESKDRHANNGYGDFDTTAAFSKYKETNFVNPLMTSMLCFNDTRFFPDGLHIEGKDLFDRSTNHTLADHGQVVIPYCSSDVWLGGEDGTRHEDIIDDTPYGCRQFRYVPDADGLQFTFRGKIIFQSVLRDLDEMYGLSTTATELILAGSSAGGVGAMNLAKWVVQEFPNLTVKVITDSAWFVNFRDGINHQFAGLQKLSAPSGNDKTDTNQPTSSSVPIGQSSHVTATQSYMISSITNEYTSSSSVLIGQSIHVTQTQNYMISSSKTHSSMFTTPLATPSPSIMTSSLNIPIPTPASGSGSGSGDNNEEEATNDDEMMKRYAPFEFEANRYADHRDRRDLTSQDDGDLLKMFKSHESCMDTSRGFPCCLSAQCLLSGYNPVTNEPYFPRNVSLFVITSLYDAFILSRAISDVQVYSSDSDSIPIGLAVEYLTVVGEYGGVMHNSLVEVQESDIDLTFYASQCFQHIYFVTSSLWGEGRLFGSDPVQINSDIGAFR